MPAYIYLLAETWTSLQFYYLRDLWRWRAGLLRRLHCVCLGPSEEILVREH